MVTEVALVVCQVNVTGWPEVTLLVLAEKTRVGADVVAGAPPELEPPQPAKAISGETAAKQKRIFEHVASRPILLSRDDEGRRPWLLLRVLLSRLVVAACNVFLLQKEPSNANIPTTVPRHFCISIPFSR
jgi:hypothetical protein